MPTPAPAKPTPEPAVPATIASLMEKGAGVLSKRNGVWSYPNAPNDRSGTNLVLPAEFVSDAAVQDALKRGDLVAKAVDAMGVVTSVGAPSAEVTAVRVVNIAQAGSVEASTELPPNSRPTHDAGRSDRNVDVARAQGAGAPAPKPGVPVSAPSGQVAPPAGGPSNAPATSPAGAPVSAVKANG